MREPSRIAQFPGCFCQGDGASRLNHKLTDRDRSVTGSHGAEGFWEQGREEKWECRGLTAHHSATSEPGKLQSTGRPPARNPVGDESQAGTRLDLDAGR